MNKYNIFLYTGKQKRIKQQELVAVVYGEETLGFMEVLAQTIIADAKELPKYQKGYNAWLRTPEPKDVVRKNHTYDVEVYMRPVHGGNGDWLKYRICIKPDCGEACA